MTLELEEARPLDQDDEQIATELRKLLGPAAMSRVSEDMWYRIVRGGRCFTSKRAERSAKMIQEQLQWRAQNGVDQILSRNIPDDKLFHECWPTMFYGKDKWGHVIMVERLQDMHGAYLRAHMSDEDIVLHRTQVMEALQAEKKRLSKKLGHRVYKHIVIFDMSSLSMSDFSKSTRTLINHLVKLSSDQYTETLWHMYIINAPFVFRAVWQAVKAFVEPDTIRKIKFTGGKYVDAMLVDGIPLSSLPERFGGSHSGESAKDLVERTRADEHSEALPFRIEGKDRVQLDQPCSKRAVLVGA